MIWRQTRIALRNRWFSISIAIDDVVFPGAIGRRVISHRND